MGINRRGVTVISDWGGFAATPVPAPVTAGTLLAIDDVTQETFGSAGTYTITAFTANLNLDLVLAATALQRGVTGVLGFLGE